MTETLTNTEICELLGWKDSIRYGVNYWIIPDAGTTDTPDFKKLEQPWFDHVIPYLTSKGYDCSTYTDAENTIVTFASIINVYETRDKKAHIAFNKALYKLREQL